MSTSPTFWSKVARTYAGQPISNLANYNDTLDRTRAHLSETDHLLEVGCGTGPTALTLARAVAQVTASDYAEGMIEIAQERLAKDGADNVTFVTSTIPKACAKGPFDAIAAFNLLHLIKDLDDSLAAIHDGLKPGGLFISKSGCLCSPIPFLWPLVKVMQAFGKAPYVRVMSQRGLLRHIRNAGFEVVETKTYRGLVPSLFVVARKPQTQN